MHDNALATRTAEHTTDAPALKDLLTYEEQDRQEELVAAAIARNDDSVADTRTSEAPFYPITILDSDGTRENYRYVLRTDAFEEDKTDILLYSERVGDAKAYDRMVVVPTEEIAVAESEGDVDSR